ncbi:hypothetical protein [Burkholderia cenocepacia]|uniref:hypothetical protein n=1 Tax=Burkholderia cenocepacia TaxID=95486 RepID=UPI002AB7C83E|nr:hypothetical protein [Burkholderia cenocepacia]
MSILDSLKLRLANPERQQELARRETSLQERAQVVAERTQNIAYREEKAKTDPQAILDAIRTDTQRQAEEAEQAKAADKLKRAFGLQSGDLIDTPEMRHALEAELGRLDVEQDERARQIADRTALLAGLEQLALIDAARARAILQEYKESSPPQSYSRDEIASMLGTATAPGNGREYDRNLDGWAKSIADRERDLRREELLLDQREKALVAKLERELGIEPERTIGANVAPAVSDTAMRGVQPAVVEVAESAVSSNIPVAGEPGQRVQEERIAEVANSGAPTADVPTPEGAPAGASGSKGPATQEVPEQGTDRPRAAAEYTLKELDDPARLKVVAAEIAQQSGKSVAEVSDGLRSMLDSVRKDVTPEKAVLDEARRTFWEGGNKRGQELAGAAPEVAASPTPADRKEKAGASTTAAIGKAAIDVLPQVDAKAVAAIADAQAAGRSVATGEKSAGSGKSTRSKGVAGFKSLGRNKSAQAGEVEVQAEAGAANGPAATGSRKASAGKEAESSSKPEKAKDAPVAAADNTAQQADGGSSTSSRSRAKFRDLSPEQKADRRTEYMQGLRQDAGLTADGKEVVKEKGKEVTRRKGKQVDGVGL